VPWHVVDIAHRRPDVRVAHVCLYVGERERLHRERPKRVPEVVEADALQPCPLQRLDVSPPHRRALQMLADDVDEDQVGLAGPPLAPAEPIQRRPGLVD
jgi:hypothetical protein